MSNIPTFSQISNYRYRSFSNTEVPYLWGYGGNPYEERTIPVSAPYTLILHESPQFNVPSTTHIYDDDQAGIELEEVSKTTTPANNQYRINYDEKGNGEVEFNAAQKGHDIRVQYYGLGSLAKIETLQSVVAAIGGSEVLEITASTNLVANDRFRTMTFIHTPTTGLIFAVLPDLTADIYGSTFKFVNCGSSAGLSRIDSKEGGNIIFDNTHKTLSSIFLCDIGDDVYFLATSSGWIITKYNCVVDIGGQNMTDETNRHFGNGVTIDNGSGVSTKSSDWTGQKVTESISGITFIVIEDTSGAGVTGNLHFYQITGVGYLTNNRVLTAGNGETVDVNAAPGTSQNVDYTLFHNLGFNQHVITNRVLISAIASLTNSIDFTCNMSYNVGSGVHGYSNYQISINDLKMQTGQAGMLYAVDAGGSIGEYNATNGYIYIRLAIKK